MSMYAEVKGATLIRFPYTYGSLMQENPYTDFGPDPDVLALFPLTETALSNGYALVEVKTKPTPDIDPKTQKLLQLDPSPEDGIWTVSWQIVETKRWFAS